MLFNSHSLAHGLVIAPRGVKRRAFLLALYFLIARAKEALNIHSLVMGLVRVHRDVVFSYHVHF